MQSLCWGVNKLRVNQRQAAAMVSEASRWAKEMMVMLEWMLEIGLRGLLMNMLETVQVCCLWEHFGSVSGKILHNSESQFLWIESCALHMASQVPVSAVLFGSKFGSHGYNHSEAISTFEKNMTLMSFCESKKAQRHFQVSVFVKFQIAFLKIQLWTPWELEGRNLFQKGHFKAILCWNES